MKKTLVDLTLVLGGRLDSNLPDEGSFSGRIHHVHAGVVGTRMTVSSSDVSCKRHILQAVELSRWLRNLPHPVMGARFTIFWQAGKADTLDGRRCSLKAGDVETNPTTNKQVWICDICHKQIHGRKQKSIRCNRIEHCVHLRCAGIRLAQISSYCWST